MSKESQLVKALREDKGLEKDKDKRLLYLTLSKHFVEDLKNNIFSNAFDLSESLAGSTVEEWTDFLDYPAVAKYTQRIVAQHTRQQASRDIAEGVKSKDALAVQKAIDEQQGRGNNHDLVVMMMPVRKAYGK